MNDIAKEYGNALFLLASEEGKRAEYHVVLETLSAAFRENEEYFAFLSSPAVSLKERLLAIDKAFADSVPDTILSYLKLLCEKGRISLLLSSMEEYQRLFEISQKQLRVKVTSAVALSEEEKEKLVKTLEKAKNCSIHAEYFIEEALLGGIVVETDSMVWDGSLKSRLQKVKEVINA